MAVSSSKEICGDTAGLAWLDDEGKEEEVVVVEEEEEEKEGMVEEVE